MNPFLDFLWHFGLKNIGLAPGTGSGCFQHPQDVVYKQLLKTVFFYLLGGKTFFGNFFENIVALAQKSSIKWSNKEYDFIFLNLNRNFKKGACTLKSLINEYSLKTKSIIWPPYSFIRDFRVSCFSRHNHSHSHSHSAFAMFIL